jgi:hypothetical protein
LNNINKDAEHWREGQWGVQQTPWVSSDTDNDLALQL